ncbi:Saposin-like_type B domin-containing protein [Hexamita inflata]|uniref:Saposin-like type B domin-containing protein n=1 Tax=Hexamita inflata TaxID=28002 RepID=A0AA86URY0_9EUKA|nr:Saposin-like type B domin-containing protein [Hexamita inflata]
MIVVLFTIQTADFDLEPKLEPTVEQLDFSAQCSLCMLIVDHVETYESDPVQIDQVTQQLQTICHQIPFIFFKNCKQTVAAHYQQLVDGIVQGFGPAIVCKAAKLCK